MTTSPAVQNDTIAKVIRDPIDKSRFAVAWAGRIHGGAHFDYMDAQLHADALNAAPTWDLCQWLDAMHYGPIGREVA